MKEDANVLTSISK